MPISQSNHESINLLWEQFVAGNKHALGVMAETLYSSLFHYGSRFSFDQCLIEDTIQDLFLSIYEKRSSLRHIASPKSYLFASLRNNLIRKLQIEPVWQNLPDNELVRAKELIADSTQEAHLEWLSETMGKTMLLLPARQREALYLRYYENLSYEEIAIVMGLKRQAVANYLHEGINRLRHYWQTILSVFTICSLF